MTDNPMNTEAVRKLQAIYEQVSEGERATKELKDDLIALMDLLTKDF